MYTVLSGYHLMKDQHSNSAASSSNADLSWKASWNLNIPPKVRFFIWRLMHEAIPSGENLLRHHVGEGLRCFWCRAVKSNTHVFSQCWWAKQLWKSVGFWEEIRSRTYENFAMVIASVLGMESSNAKAVMCMSIWAIWNERNDVKHGSKSMDPAVLGSRTMIHLERYQAVNGDSRQGSNLNGSNFTDTRWRRRCDKRSGIILYTDAAVFSSSAGLGGVFCSLGGHIIGAFAVRLSGQYTVEVAEAYALRQGLRLALEQDIQVEDAKIDALKVVHGLDDYNNCNILALLYDYLRYLFDSVLCELCSYIPHRANTVAHSLATFA